MSEESKQEILEEIKQALSQVPAKYQAEIGRSIVHDIGVMVKAIHIVNSNSGATPGIQ